jgi:tRNA(fMet)-specific endonuclease VapC
VIHLDSNVLIGLLNDRPRDGRRRFDGLRQRYDRLFVSVVVYHELMYGAAASARRLENEDKVIALFATAGISLVDLDEEDARVAADIRARLKREGTPIGPYDLLIAAQAVARKVPLVTANVREFARVPDLTVVDWSA